jgi:hypothetical protein
MDAKASSSVGREAECQKIPLRKDFISFKTSKNFSDRKESNISITDVYEILSCSLLDQCIARKLFSWKILFLSSEILFLPRLINF